MIRGIGNLRFKTTKSLIDLKPEQEKHHKRHERHKFSYIHLFKYTTRLDECYISLALFFSVMVGIVIQLNSFLFAKLFQSMVDYGTSIMENNPKTEEFFLAIEQFAVHSSLQGLTIVVLSYFSTTLINIAAYNQIFRIRQLYLKAILSQDFEYYDSTNTEFMSKMSEDVVKIQDGIGEKLVSFVLLLTSFCTSLLLAFLAGWELTFESIFLFPLILCLMTITIRVARDNSVKQANTLNKASALAEEVITSIKTVYAFSGQQKEIKSYAHYLKQAQEYSRKNATFNGLALGLMVFCSHFMFGYAVWFAYKLMSDKPEQYTIENCSFILLCILSGSSNFGLALGLVENFVIARRAGFEIFSLIERVPKINKSDNKHVIPEVIKGAIELENVSFRYPSRPDVQVLRGVSLKVKPGQTVALIGESGSGKSTILQLMCRLYDVDEGSVVVDGMDVRQISLQWLRSRISLVLPDPTLFNTNVRHNISYGNENTTLLDVQDAARKAHAHAFIMDLPQGYETMVGERGTDLSNGQQQRIAIARALVRKPLLLMLDEAVGQLDPAAQYKIQKVLSRLKTHTTIVVSSVLSAIKHADYIYVIDRGRVIESGTHKTLMERKGTYHHMSLREGFSTDNIPQDFFPYEMEEDRRTELHFDEEQLKLGVEEDVSDNQDGSKVTFTSLLRLSSPEWKSIIVASISAFINGFEVPLTSVIIARMIESLSNPNELEKLTNVIQTRTIIIVIGALIGTSNFLECVFYAWAGEKLTRGLRNKLFRSILRQEIAFFDEVVNSPEVLCVKLSSDAAIMETAANHLGSILQGLGALLIALTMSFMYEWRIAVFAVFLLPILIWCLYKQGRQSSDEFHGLENISAKCSALAAEAITNIRTVAILGREEQFLAEYAKQYVIVHRFAKKRVHFRGLIFGLSLGVYNFFFAAALYFGGTLIYDGVRYSKVLASTQALLLGANSSVSVLMFAPNIENILESTSDVLGLINRKSKIEEPPINPLIFFRGSGEASLENVQFSYPTRPDIVVLNEFSLKIEKGQTVGLVGVSGAGKSTVIKLLLRYYAPDEGTVCLDGIPLNEILEIEARKDIGFVPQESVVFDRTIAENIAYGDNSRTPTREEIIEVAKMVNLHKFIMILPLGYDTILGNQGHLLSNGEKRRLSVARALIRKPTLLLLDEAAHTLDAESERRMQEALEQAQTGRACLTVSHRLSRVRHSDIIAVMNDGKIVEQGSHSELIRKKGLYFEMNKYEKSIS